MNFNQAVERNRPFAHFLDESGDLGFDFSKRKTSM